MLTSFLENPTDFVFKLLWGTLIFIIIILTINRIINKCIIKKMAHILSSIEAKGYKWAAKPWQSNNIYISAKKEDVVNVGHQPNGTILYQTNNGEKFYWDDDISYAIIDILGHIHILKDHMALLAIEDKKLIIPSDCFIIRESNEAADFLEFEQSLKKYSYPDRPTKTDYAWDTEFIDNEIRSKT